MPDLDPIIEKLQTLVLKFEGDKTHYLSKGYPELQVRSFRKNIPSAGHT